MEIHKLIDLIQNGDLDKKMIDIYIDAECVEYQKKRYIDAIAKFEASYGAGEVQIFSAPGRSEISGNHTDHQHGKVLACAINLDAVAVVRKSDLPQIRLVSDDRDELVVDITNLAVKESEKGTSLALVKGVVAGFRDRGYKALGFDAYITSDVLIGSGMSSSAAFEILVGSVLSGLYNEMQVSYADIATIGQFAENVYFGKPCGLMDQMTCAAGGLVYIDFKNPKEPVVEKIPFDLEKYGYSLCITDTRGSHADLTEEYAAIPQEMSAVAKYFGKEVLGEVSLDELLNNVPKIRRRLNDRCVLRAIHFLCENKRVEDAVEALKSRDIDLFLRTIKNSGNSSYKFLQNVYSTQNVYQQNLPLALALSETVLGDKGVCRVHGGGFAGTIQTFVKNEEVKVYQGYMDRIFGKGACGIFKIRQYGGILVV